MCAQPLLNTAATPAPRPRFRKVGPSAASFLLRPRIRVEEFVRVLTKELQIPIEQDDARDADRQAVANELGPSWTRVLADKKHRRAHDDRSEAEVAIKAVEVQEAIEA